MALTTAPTPARRTIRVDVFSDFTCGWCYFAHKELCEGIALARTASLPADFHVQYHPYILHPALPVTDPSTGTPPIPSRNAFLESKIGSEKWAAIGEMITKRAKEEGVVFSTDGPLSNTLRAHRLMKHAWMVGGQAAQQALVSALLDAAFIHHRDIGDVDTLAEVALAISQQHAANGVATTNGTSPTISAITNGALPDTGADAPIPPLFESTTSAREWLLSSALAAEVQSASASAAHRGVAGVPCAVIDGRWAVAGCQSPQCYYKVFEKIATGVCSGKCPSLPGKANHNGGAPNANGAGVGVCVGGEAGATVIKADAGTVCSGTAGEESGATATALPGSEGAIRTGTASPSPPPSSHMGMGVAVVPPPTAVAI